MAKKKLSFAQRVAYLGAGLGLISALLSIIADLLFKHTPLGDRLSAEAVDVVLTWLGSSTFRVELQKVFPKTATLDRVFPAEKLSA